MLKSMACRQRLQRLAKFLINDLRLLESLQKEKRGINPNVNVINLRISSIKSPFSKGRFRGILE